MRVCGWCVRVYACATTVVQTPARDFNWIEPVDLVPGDSLLCRYRIRYRQDEVCGTLAVVVHGWGGSVV